VPNGRRVAILTNAGGPGVTAADALELNGMSLSPLQPETIAALQELLPPFASVHNPIDMLASASPEQYGAGLQLLLADETVDSVLIILPPPPMYATGAVARAIIPYIYAATKPVIVAVMGERMIQEAVEHFRAAHVPEYRFPERAASALAVLSQRADYLASHQSEPVVPENVDKAAVAQILAAEPEGEFITQDGMMGMLAAYGIPTPPLELAETADQAVTIARAMGYPVALKVASPAITHKSDVGGVLLNLKNATAVSDGYARIMDAVTAAHPDAVIEGVHVQPMITEGQEVIVGMVRDPQFGPVMMFGSGGIEVEGLHDVDFALAPLLQTEAEEMLANTWAGRKLDGYRNIAAGDKTAVLDILIRLGQLAADFPQLAEIEINPVRVLSQGAFAVDARAMLEK
jgi:acetyltransferase